MNTIDQLTQLIHEKFGIDKPTLQADRPLADYGLDSLALAELLFTIEEEFGIEFPDRPENIDTLGGLAALIDELRSAKQA